MKYVYLAALILAVVLGGCKSSQQATDRQRIKKKDKKDKQAMIDYEEDLSVWRPSYQDSLLLLAKIEADNKEEAGAATKPVIAQHDITVKLNDFLKAVAERDKDHAFSQGYTIQVYLGDNRQEAEDVIKRVNHIFPDTWSRMLFESPFYKVQLGKFLDERDAYKTFTKAQSSFKTVAMVPAQIKLAEL